MTQQIEKAIVDASQIYPTTYQKPYLDGGIFGYKLAIDKACEYLEEYTPQKFEDVQNYVENFRKAMEGGEE